MLGVMVCLFLYSYTVWSQLPTATHTISSPSDHICFIWEDITLNNPWPWINIASPSSSSAEASCIVASLTKNLKKAALNLFPLSRSLDRLPHLFPFMCDYSMLQGTNPCVWYMGDITWGSLISPGYLSPWCPPLSVYALTNGPPVYFHY